jgi:ABC-type multidrug transport system fused ATPase/permease subunit
VGFGDAPGEATEASQESNLNASHPADNGVFPLLSKKNSAEMSDKQQMASLVHSAETLSTEEFESPSFSSSWFIICSVRSVLWAQGRGINFLYLLSCLFAMVEAAVFPLLCVSTSELTVVVLAPNHNSDTVALWCGMLAVIAVGNVIISYLRTITAHLHGTKITQRLRTAVMRQIVHQSASWYDVHPDATGMFPKHHH